MDSFLLPITITTYNDNNNNIYINDNNPDDIIPIISTTNESVQPICQS